jgi:tRNA uridine 5-carbamoylmethylation protein Kti12
MSLKKVYIMRGVPGSGKSSYVEKVVRSLDDQAPVNVEVCSADHYFMTGCPHEGDYGKDPNSQRNFRIHLELCMSEKIYQFKPNEIGKAHQACQDRFIKLIESDDSMYIFVDNTNTTKRELDFYVKACVGHDIQFTIVNVRCDVEKAAKRNSHGVPSEKVRQMAARMNHGDEELSKLDWPQQEYYSG